MNLASVPATPQYHSMYDGSKAINQNEQVTFNSGVQLAIQQLNNAIIELSALNNGLKDRLNDQNILYTHFQQFVNDHHPGVIKEYAATLLVQAKLEQANGN